MLKSKSKKCAVLGSLPVATGVDEDLLLGVGVAPLPEHSGVPSACVKQRRPRMSAMRGSLK